MIWPFANHIGALPVPVALGLNVPASVSILALSWYNYLSAESTTIHYVLVLFLNGAPVLDLLMNLRRFATTRCGAKIDLDDGIMGRESVDAYIVSQNC